MSNHSDQCWDPSIYQTPISSPTNTTVDIVAFPPPETSSLASAQLDFSVPSETDQTSLEHSLITLQDYFRANSTSTSIYSSHTLVPHSIIPCDFEITSVNTNPVIDTGSTHELHHLVDNIKKISLDFTQLQSLEDQVKSVSLKAKLLRENLLQQNHHLLDQIQKFLERQEFRSQKQIQNAQTQTCVELSCNDNKKRNLSNFQTLENGIESFDQNHLSTQFNQQTRHHFKKLAAFAKGYLTRRLIQTEKVQLIKRTITDTSKILMQFKSNLLRNGKLLVTHQDILFHQRLCIQLENSCKEFYSIFFETSVKEKMKIIANHRDYLKNSVFLKEKRSNSVLSQNTLRALSRDI